MYQNNTRFHIVFKWLSTSHSFRHHPPIYPTSMPNPGNGYVLCPKSLLKSATILALKQSLYYRAPYSDDNTVIGSTACDARLKPIKSNERISSMDSNWMKKRLWPVFLTITVITLILFVSVSEGLL